MRLVAFLIFGALLAGCSGSSRVESIAPVWVNQSPRSGAPQRAADRNTPDTTRPDQSTEAREPKKSAARPIEEE